MVLYALNLVLTFLGKEVGRFIYGAYGLFNPAKPTQHLHSKNVLKIIERNFIGTIQNEYQIFIKY